MASLNRDFRVREEARKRLFDRFDIYREVIAKKIVSPKLSLESSRRLTSIRDRFLDSEGAHELADILELMKDVPYVVSLLEAARAEDVPHVIRRLEAMTGETLGPTPAAWQAWAATTKR